MAVYEGKWKCTYCGQANLGRDTKCQSCGNVRAADVQFYLDNQTEVTDAERLLQAHGGADWTCLYCGKNNRGSDTKCKQCSADRGDAVSLQEKMTGNTGPAAVPAPAQASGKKKGPLLGILAGLGAVVLIYFLFFATSVKNATLTGGQWQRTIGIERYDWVNKSAWEGEVPSGAVILSQRSEKYGVERVQTGTERVKVGTRDKGNGYFEDVYEDRPTYTEHDVYKTKVYYKRQEWVEIRRVEKTGGLKDPPEWPAYTLDQLEREGKRKESASLNFSTGKKQYQYGVPVSELASYETDRNYKISVTVTGAVKKVQR